MKGIYLKTARDRKGWTQEDLERVSGVSQGNISRLENDSNAIGAFDTVVKLADALDIDPRSLRFGPDPRELAKAAH